MKKRQKQKKRLLIALTPGDPDGIGPEITWKILSKGNPWKKDADILCVGAREPFERMGAKVICTDVESVSKNAAPPQSKEPAVWLIPAPPTVSTGVQDGVLFLPGFQAGWSIQAATELVKRKVASALVTGPINKERLQMGGFRYPGHTEFLASLCGAKSVTMMLANQELRVSLVTIHVALKDVAAELTEGKIRLTVQNTVNHLKRWWGIARPKIAVAALNPHAGEKGLFGAEEADIIVPAVKQLQKMARGKFDVAGPFPADSLFAMQKLTKPSERFDAIVCMYHDQGLIPVKLLDFRRTVNITLGLPIIRTSVDHGVGFDLVGTGKADPSSLRAAIETAIRIANLNQILTQG